MDFEKLAFANEKDLENRLIYADFRLGKNDEKLLKSEKTLLS